MCDQLAEDLADLWRRDEVTAEAWPGGIIAVLAIMQTQIHIGCDRDRAARPDHRDKAILERRHAFEVTPVVLSAFQTSQAPPSHMGSDRICPIVIHSGSP